MVPKRRLAGNIRRELITARLAELEEENAELRESNIVMRGLLHEFLSTHCAPLELRERATAAVGKPPLEFGKEKKP